VKGEDSEKSWRGDQKGTKFPKKKGYLCTCACWNERRKQKGWKVWGVWEKARGGVVSLHEPEWWRGDIATKRGLRFEHC